MDDLFRYDGKRALVVGCYSGMGAATAKIVQSLGGEVHGVDYKDPDYELAGFTRSIGSTFSLRALFNHLRARRKGFRQGRLAGDPWQQGGTLIVAPSGEVLFEYRSKGPGDHAAPERLVAALRGA